MFGNLRTGSKLFLLCTMFVVALAVTTYSLVSEKLIAIEFARKELVGSKYLATVREVYDAVLIGPPDGIPVEQPTPSLNDAIASLQSAEAEAGGTLHTASLQRALVEALRGLTTSEASRSEASNLDALSKAQALATRVGDDSNLTLDPDLDTYYLQHIVVSELPAFLGRLGELETLSSDASRPGDEQRARFLFVVAELQSSAERIRDDLAGAYRGNSGEDLRQRVQSPFQTMLTNMNIYLAGVRAGTAPGVGAVASASGGDAYWKAVSSGIVAWAAAQSQLDNLLQRRVDGFVTRLQRSLLLTCFLAALSILLAVLTHRHIVVPLERFERVARSISESKNYDLRIDQSSHDEIGKLAGAFNEMLSELAAAREREIEQQAEMEQVSRLTSMGAVSASIAHEINQPLAAIVTNSNAALRWLGRPEPDLEEARAALKRIADDGHRASELIASIRAMFNKGDRNVTSLDLNDLVRETLLLASSNLRRHGTSSEVVLNEQLPKVLADRTQLQQVVLNLVINAAQAMTSVTDRQRLLRVATDVDDSGSVVVLVADSGPGIDAETMDRIFGAFFSTKPSGMGMGLFISRSIVEAHGGRLWASSGERQGTTFHVVLPIGRADGA